MKTVKVYTVRQLKDACLNTNVKIKLMNNFVLDSSIKLYDNTIIDGRYNFIDFRNFSGFIIEGNRNIIKRLHIYNSGSNGIKIEGSCNKIEDVVVRDCKKTGIQICNGGSYNKIINCTSYGNRCGDNSADGFACKLYSEKRNIFCNCTAFNNEDDGFDLFMANESVKIKNCIAYNNGGSGFKLGGLKSEVDLNYDIHHKITRCVSYRNVLYGFTSNNQVGEITLKKCSSRDNIKGNYFFPKISHPKALDFEPLKLGKTYVKDCFFCGPYSGAPNNFEGAVIIHTLKESLKFFLKLL